MPVTDREERILGIIETARAKRGKFRDERINMAHGAGGKATQSMIEGLFEPGLRRPGSTEDAAGARDRRRCARVHHRLASSSSRSASRVARSGISR